jgi:RNA polymerase sigma-70 factor (ECF subfamily)
VTREPIKKTDNPFDAAEIDACRRGDREAQGRVLRAEAPRLRTHIGCLLGPGGDVDDVLQATLIAAVQGFSRFRGEASLSTWLKSIAVNKVVDQLRRGRANRRVVLEVVPGGMDQPAATVSSAYARVEARRRMDALYVHLEQLSATLRVALVLHVFEGHSIAEVAALLNCSRTAAKVRVFRARRALLASVKKDPVLMELLEGAP